MEKQQSTNNENQKDTKKNNDPIAARLMLAGALVFGGASLAGCSDSNANAQPGGTDTPAAQPGNPVDPTEPANNPADPTTQPDDPNKQDNQGGDTDDTAADLPADWETWGVSKEVAIARWNYIQSQARKLQEQYPGSMIHRTGVLDDDVNKWEVVVKLPNGEIEGGIGDFPIAHKPPLY
ncbi:MAG: hypothetical protein LBO07_02860 [Coriobacteriales bacterium]|nr:hypothetical protein [Coriobacteriales bacterium]